MMILNYQSKKAKKGSAVRVYTGDVVQLKDGVGTVIACQHKKDGLQRCLLKMLKSGKEIETTVNPRQVIYSNVDNTTYSLGQALTNPHNTI